MKTIRQILAAYRSNDNNYTIEQAEKELLDLFSVSNSEADVCPECGYPKFKKTFEDFERCHGCNWTSEGI